MKFQSQWRALYREQALQTRVLAAANKGGIFERACFVFQNRDFLEKAGRLRLRDIARFCLSAKALTKRVEAVHRGERTALATWERKLSDGAAHIAWREHMQDFQIMRARQQLERDGLAYSQHAERENAARAIAPTQQQQPVTPEPPTRQAAPELGPGEAITPQDIKPLVCDTPPLRNAFADATEPVKPNAADPVDDMIQRMEAYKRDNPRRDFEHRRRR